MSADARLRLLGGFTLFRGDREVQISSAKQRGLIAYLALTHPVAQSRSSVLSMFWGSRFEDQARQSLRQALTRLRRVAGKDFIDSNRDLVGLGSMSLRCDASDVLELAYDGSPAGLMAAIEPTGELLDGISIEEQSFNDWLQQMRQRILDARLEALLKLGEIALRDNDLARSITFAERALQLDELREDAHRFLISSLVAAGRRSEAVRHAESAERLFRKELGIGLSPETRRLQEDLLVDGPAPERVLPEASPSVVVDAQYLSTSDGSPFPQGSVDAVSEGERQRITFLAIDFHMAPDLFLTVDAEDVLFARRQLETLVSQVVPPLLGTVDVSSAQPIVARFGYPAPLETAAESAISAAFAIMDKAGSKLISAAAGRPLSIGIGIASGDVVVSPIAANGNAIRFVGVAPLLATHLQREADAQTILIDEHTYDATRNVFEFGGVETSTSSDFGEAIRFRQVIRPSGVIDRFTAYRRPDAPLVERDEELKLCLGRWRQAQAGRGQVIMLTGEAGIGKSRLASELVRLTANHDRDVWHLQCHPRGDRSPLHPLADYLRVQFPEGGHRTVEATAAWLRGPLASISADLSDLADFVAYLLMEEHSEASVSGGLPPHAPEEMRDKAIDTTCLLLRRLSERRPQFVVLEDIHWIDSLSCQLLAAAVEDCADWPVMIVMTTRGKAPEELVEGAHVLSMPLSRLTRAGIAGIVESFWEPARPPEGLVEAICARCEGNPLFAEEQASFVRRQNRDVSDPSLWQDLLGSSESTLQTVLASWLDTAGSAKQLIQTASVIGREFSSDVLTRIVAPKTSTIDRDRIRELLVETGLIRPKRGGHANRFMFRHALIHDAAYRSMLRANRKVVHDRIVSLAASGEIAGLSDETMAWHCENAGRHTEAASHLIAAAEAAAARSAIAEASNLLSSAIAQLELVDRTAEIERLRLRLLMVRGPVEIALHGPGSEEARAVYETGVELCRQMAEPAGEYFPLFWGWWFTAPDIAIQNGRAEEIVEAHSGDSDPEVQLQSLHCGWAAAFDVGNHKRCRALIEKGLHLYDPERAIGSRTRYAGHDTRVCALGELGLTLWFLGMDERAGISTAEAMTYAESLGHLGSILHAIDIAIMLASCRRDFVAVDTLAVRMRHLADQHRLPGFEAKSMIFGGWAQGMTSEPPAGVARIEAGLAKQQSIGTSEDFPVYLDMYCELLAGAGAVDKAAGIIQDAISRAERQGHRSWLAELYRRRASIERLAGQSARTVKESLGIAMRIASEQDAKALERRAAQDLQALLGSQVARG